jgi:FSR family fosmidomycin resistance protein-like MFS transporter
MPRSRSSRGILAILTTSHLAQHLYVGISILYPNIMADLSISYTELGIITGSSSAISGFLQIVYSIAARYYPRRILLGLGNILYSASIFGIGLARGFYMFLASNVLGGVGTSSQHPVGVSMLSDGFKDRIAKALGIFYGLGYVGNIVSPLFLTAIALVWGWRSALFALAIFPAVIGLILILYFRGEMVGNKSVSGDKNASLTKDVWSCLRNKSALIIIIAQAFGTGGTGQGVIATYIPLFLRNSLGLDSLTSSVIYSITMVGGIVGTVFLGRYANRIGSLKTAVICTALTAALVFLLTSYISFGTVLVPHLFAMAVVTFPIFSLMQTYLVSMSAQTEKDILTGLFLTVGFGVGSVWSIITGYLIDTYKSFAPAWLFMFALSMISLFFQMWAYRLRK